MKLIFGKRKDCAERLAEGVTRQMARRAERTGRERIGLKGIAWLVLWEGKFDGMSDSDCGGCDGCMVGQWRTWCLARWVHSVSGECQGGCGAG